VGALTQDVLLSLAFIGLGGSTENLSKPPFLSATCGTETTTGVMPVVER